MGTARFKELWVKYNAGTLLPEERIVFEELLLSLSEEEVSRVIDETIEVDMGIHYARDVVFERIEERVGKEQPRSTRRLAWVRYAAAVLIAGIVSVGLMKLDFWKEEPTTDLAVTPVDITLPDDKALVKLGDGSVFVVNDSLDRLETKDVAVQRIGEGVYRFDVLAQPGTKEEFLSFSTPKGVSNQVILSDGTKIWLNARSKLEVSSYYEGNGKREVRLMGEGYFEVAHNKQRPFRVQIEGAVVEVLGTSFNIQTGNREKTAATTLIEGSVSVRNDGSKLILSPGEQAYVQQGVAGLQKKKVDVRTVVAWKNGYFSFVDRPIEEVVEELVNWYDVDGVEWRKKSKEKVTASLTRTRSLGELLTKLEMISTLKFTIKERRIVVE
ncbi:MAG: FecR domain-containing protein [Sphingobacterium sp.]|nr:FecR domain-containing protein [Sphingobacterium sp.]